MLIRIRTILLLAFLCLVQLSVKSQQPTKEDVIKPVKTIIQSIRLNKDDLALKYFDAEAQGRFLLGDNWAKGTAAQQREFIQLFQSLVSKIAFPKVRDNFKNLISITYDVPVVSGKEAIVNSTIIIEHPTKRQEMKCKYTLVKQQEWKVVDVVVLGDSMLTGVRDDQVKSVLKEGGWNQLLSLMRKKNTELGR